LWVAALLGIASSVSAAALIRSRVLPSQSGENV
jgi:hypothetical protein